MSISLRPGLDMLERLHKVLARAGVAALRPAEDMIMQGRVTVNGRVVRELGARVDPNGDVIAVDGQLIQLPEPGETRRYVAVYKPIGVVSTARDTHERPTVVGLVPTDARLFPVGRLDLESEGLLLLTDDGELAYRLTHPRFEVEKEYRVLLDRSPSVEDLRRWRDGVELDGEMTMPAWVEVQERAPNGVWVRIVMREGRKRQIREIAKLLGYDVRRLIRVREGTLGLGELVPGQWRELAPDEIEALRVHVRHVPGPPADEQESHVPTRIPSDDEQAGEAGARRPRRIPPRPGFGARGPTRRTYTQNDENDSSPERRDEAPAGRATESRPRQDTPDERPRRQDTGDRERAPYGDSDSARRGGDNRRSDDRSPRRDEGQRKPYSRQTDRPASYGNREQGQRGSYGNRDQGRSGNSRDQGGSYGNRQQGGSYGNRDQAQRGPDGRRTEGQRAPYGNRDDRQSQPYGNRNTGASGGRGPAGGRSRSSLDPRQGRPSDGGRSRSSLDPRSRSGERSRSSLDPRQGRPSDGGRSRSSLDPRSRSGERSRSSLDPRQGRPSDGGRSRSSLDPRSRSGERSRSSLDPRSRSGEGRDRPTYGRSNPNRSSSGRPGQARDGGPARGNSRGSTGPNQRDDRYGGGQRDNRYGGRSTGGSRPGGTGSNSTRPSDPNRRPGPSRPNNSSRQGQSNSSGATDNTRRSPGPRPRPNRRPREEENET